MSATTMHGAMAGEASGPKPKRRFAPATIVL
jgi:hypothetical protein